MSHASVERFPTSRLVAEPISLEHFPEIHCLHADPNVMRTLSADGRPLSEVVTQEHLRQAVEHWRQHGFGFWVFRAKSDGQFIGRGGLKNYQIDKGEVIGLAYAVLSAFATGLAYGLLVGSVVGVLSYTSLAIAFGPGGDLYEHGGVIRVEHFYPILERLASVRPKMHGSPCFLGQAGHECRPMMTREKENEAISGGGNDMEKHRRAPRWQSSGDGVRPSAATMKRSRGIGDTSGCASRSQATCLRRE